MVVGMCLNVLSHCTVGLTCLQSYSGAREVLPFITEGEKPPALMGFNMSDDAANLPAKRISKILSSWPLKVKFMAGTSTAKMQWRP